MPKFIGATIDGAKRMEVDNFVGSLGETIRLSYSQAVLLDTSDVMCSLDTTDHGSRGALAKRWYRWFSTPAAILAHPRATKMMRQRALNHLYLVRSSLELMAADSGGAL